MAETYSTRSSRVCDYRASRGTGERNIPQARAAYLRERARCAHLARTQDVPAHLRSGQSESASSPIVCNSTRAARRVRRGRDSGHRIGAQATPFLHARIPPPRKHLARGTRGRRRRPAAQRGARARVTAAAPHAASAEHPAKNGWRPPRPWWLPMRVLPANDGMPRRSPTAHI
jgi:hypothetical protein